MPAARLSEPTQKMDGQAKSLSLSLNSFALLAARHTRITQQQQAQHNTIQTPTNCGLSQRLASPVFRRCHEPGHRARAPAAILWNRASKPCQRSVHARARSNKNELIGRSCLLVHRANVNQTRVQEAQEAQEERRMREREKRGPSDRWRLLLVLWREERSELEQSRAELGTQERSVRSRARRGSCRATGAATRAGRSKTRRARACPRPTARATVAALGAGKAGAGRRRSAQARRRRDAPGAPMSDRPERIDGPR